MIEFATPRFCALSNTHAFLLSNNHTAEFKYSLFFSNGIMFCVYCITMVIGYHFRGNEVDAFLPASLPAGTAKSIVNLLLAYHTLVSYLINNQPLCRHLMAQWWPGTRPNHALAVLRWRYLSLGFLVTAWVVANLIPFFGAFQEILGSLLAAPVLFFFPPFFYVSAVRTHNDSLGCGDRLACAFMMYVVCPVLMVLGFVSSVKELFENWETYGLPFSCHPSASAGGR